MNGARLPGAQPKEARLPGAQLKEARLQGAQLNEAQSPNAHPKRPKNKEPNRALKAQPS